MLSVSNSIGSQISSQQQSHPYRSQTWKFVLVGEIRDKNRRFWVGSKIVKWQLKKKDYVWNPELYCSINLRKLIVNYLDKTGHSYEADVWSFGVIAYAMLIGKPPF